MIPISKQLYDRKTNDFWLGRKVVSLRSISNAHMELPAGTTFEVQRKYKGFSVRSEACPHCGVRMRCDEVHYASFELVDEPLPLVEAGR